ncbi:hypothetical protein RUM44_005017 [Polyplax serrata]|uniref:Uncharacterized protein n=1 Tax=Polyplax serrata TaxID=468196 RepID=A0ABR1AXC2_POLSC
MFDVSAIGNKDSLRRPPDGEQRASTLLLFLVYLKDMSLKWKLVWMLQMSLALTRETISKKRNLLYGECGFVSKWGSSLSAGRSTPRGWSAPPGRSNMPNSCKVV